MHVHDWTIEYQSRFANTLTYFLGLWLLVAPYVLGYAGAIDYRNNYFVGILVVALALSRRFMRGDTEWASWTQFFLGVWLLFAPFVIGYSDVGAAVVNDVLLGIALAIISSWSASSSWVSTHRWT